MFTAPPRPTASVQRAGVADIIVINNMSRGPASAFEALCVAHMLRGSAMIGGTLCIQYHGLYDDMLGCRPINVRTSVEDM